MKYKSTSWTIPLYKLLVWSFLSQSLRRKAVQLEPIWFYIYFYSKFRYFECLIFLVLFLGVSWNTRGFHFEIISRKFWVVEYCVYEDNFFFKNSTSITPYVSVWIWWSGLWSLNHACGSPYVLCWLYVYVNHLCF